tara:strand:- start:827 stop:1141 length:315 start_codon:yes stop_codon:yes gene_type:complete
VAEVAVLTLLVLMDVAQTMWQEMVVQVKILALIFQVLLTVRHTVVEEVVEFTHLIQQVIKETVVLEEEELVVVLEQLVQTQVLIDRLVVAVAVIVRLVVTVVQE